jgi:hypothetical protein
VNVSNLCVRPAGQRGLAGRIALWRRGAPGKLLSDGGQAVPAERVAHVLKHLLRAGALLLLTGLLLPHVAADARDDKPDPAKKEDAAKKDDKGAKTDAKADDKDVAAKKDAAKKDDNNAKADAAKKDDKDAKKDAAKKDDPKKDDAKKDVKKSDKKDDRVNTEKSISGGQLTGKIVAVETSRKSIKLSVAVAVPKLDVGAVNSAVGYRVSARESLAQYQQLLNQAQQASNQAQQALSKKDKNGYTQNMNQASQYQTQATQYQVLAAQQNATATRLEANSYRSETQHQDVEIIAVDEVKVRRQSPEDVYDDKGKKRRLTPKELKEAKGDDAKAPGYQADFTSLKEEQVVTVTLLKPKDPPKLKPGAKKDADAAQMLENLPHASMIMIIADAPLVK